MQIRDGGADRPSLMKVFKSIIRAKIKYAAVAYSSARMSNFKLLDNIQDKCLCIVCGAYYTSPMLSIYCEAGELPPNYRREIILTKYCFKMLEHQNHTLHECIRNPHLLLSYSLPSHTRNPNPVPINFHKILNKYNFDLNWLINYGNDGKISPWMLRRPMIDTKLLAYRKETTDAIIYRTNFNASMEGKEEFTKIYTDGSKTNQGTGCAITEMESNVNREFPLNKRCSIFTAEMYAILQSLEYVKELSNVSHVNVYTDSISSCQILRQLYPKHRIVQTHSIENT